MGSNRDRDLVPHDLDNCPAVSKDDQADEDGNRIGDGCETEDIELIFADEFELTGTMTEGDAAWRGAFLPPVAPGNR